MITRFLVNDFSRGVARTSGVHGQGTVRGPQTNGIFGLILVGGPLDPRGPWALPTLSTRLLRASCSKCQEFSNIIFSKHLDKHRVRNQMLTILGSFSKWGARCSSVERAFAHGAMGRRIDPSWWTH